MAFSSAAATASASLLALATALASASETTSSADFNRRTSGAAAVETTSPLLLLAATSGRTSGATRALLFHSFCGLLAVLVATRATISSCTTLRHARRSVWTRFPREWSTFSRSLSKRAVLLCCRATCCSRRLTRSTARFSAAAAASRSVCAAASAMWSMYAVDCFSARKSRRTMSSSSFRSTTSLCAPVAIERSSLFVALFARIWSWKRPSKSMNVRCSAAIVVSSSTLARALRSVARFHSRFRSHDQHPPGAFSSASSSPSLSTERAGETEPEPSVRRLSSSSSWLPSNSSWLPSSS